MRAVDKAFLNEMLSKLPERCYVGQRRRFIYPESRKYYAPGRMIQPKDHIQWEAQEYIRDDRLYTMWVCLEPLGIILEG